MVEETTMAPEGQAPQMAPEEQASAPQANPEEEAIGQIIQMIGAL
jgi:hypothetical protein